ncbi:MAG: phenylalanine--tRNA ligase subunit alpha [Deltaproteobacteria bacterium]|nr:phenylalanine--tRNA ligase subunit alpha [Deltaproteobacteria bacterium]MBW2052407.1 phenylalanine--tRNA ligase subunit alpha [Deltaproteobacteria bacterium]MBW2140130.1 phenylalanine--tRNA ligase subunit alpha [Deltaproteobacteria bacterium]MBW2322236.1 phenylalanine--tRNA ligase subunit alpha [Deltaproteobacteria bacterium]
MKEKLSELGREALEILEKADTVAEIENLRIKYLGKKGLVTGFMRQMGSVSAEERPAVGQVANRVKTDLASAIKSKLEALSDAEEAKTSLDVTLPGRRHRRGHRHPITRTLNEMCDIFIRMGFDIAEGPEVESDYYNFEALNFPKDHPARDMQDTLYINDNVVLRTHTSPMQIRTMEKKKPPVWVVIPGKTYRRDSDVSHTPMFHQVEGLVVDKGITFGDLKGVLTVFVHQFFSPDTPLRFRPSFFPFTEPSAEVDIGCVICHGSGCRTCGYKGWLEILGSGMVDPEVFKFVDYDPQEVSGFAFGVGIERVAMLKYGIDDLRLFFDNDLRFLKQF